MDQLLIVVALLVISGISSWLKKRAQAEEQRNQGQPPVGAPQATRPLRRPEQEMPADWEEQTPPPVRRPQQNVPVDWEQELRRMLDMAPEEKAPAPPPPLIIVSSEPPPVRRPAAPARVAGPPAEEPATGALHHAADTMHAARHLQETVEERIHMAGELRGAAIHSTPAMVFVKRREGLPEDFRRREGLRKAFMASVVFGPPKALSETADAPF